MARLRATDLYELAKSNLNGRQLKTMIRTASTLAKFDGDAVDNTRRLEKIDGATRLDCEMFAAPDYLAGKPANPALVKATWSLINTGKGARMRAFYLPARAHGSRNRHRS